MCVCVCVCACVSMSVRVRVCAPLLPPPPCRGQVMNAEMLANTVEVELIYEEVKYMTQVRERGGEGRGGKWREGEGREGKGGEGRGGRGREGGEGREGRGEEKELSNWRNKCVGSIVTICSFAVVLSACSACHSIPSPTCQGCSDKCQLLLCHHE